MEARFGWMKDSKKKNNGACIAYYEAGTSGDKTLFLRTSQKLKISKMSLASDMNNVS